MSAGDLPALPELLTDRELQSLRNLMPGLGSDAADEIVELRAAVAQRDEQIEQSRETIRKIAHVLVSAGFAADPSFVWFPWDDVQRMADTIIALRAEVDALRKDAERYRWLRDKAPAGIGDMASVRGSHSADDVDAAIDAARAEAKEGKG